MCAQLFMVAQSRTKFAGCRLIHGKNLFLHSQMIRVNGKQRREYTRAPYAGMNTSWLASEAKQIFFFPANLCSQLYSLCRQSWSSRPVMPSSTGKDYLTAPMQWSAFFGDCSSCRLLRHACSKKYHMTAPQELRVDLMENYQVTFRLPMILPC